MKNSNGRRSRKKRRRKREDAYSVTLSHEAPFVNLRRWLKKKGFSSRSLVPASFSDIGRGLMATKPIKANDLLISLPERCLLTTGTVLKSYMGEYIKRWQPPVSPLVALCSFLIAERHFGDASEWSPYIKVLPKSYTCPVYFSDDIMELLPYGLRKKAADQREQFQELYSSSQPFFSSLQPLFTQPIEDLFTQDAFRWAWSSVNTRTVYMEHVQSDFLSREKDVLALAPYLDLLNHCPKVQSQVMATSAGGITKILEIYQEYEKLEEEPESVWKFKTKVEAGFNKLTRCYEIRTIQSCRKFQQAFICYGPHDNQRLLLEYGFVAPGNQHSVVYVDLGILKVCLNEGDKQLRQKLLFLKDNDFLKNLTFGIDGPSWRLMTVLKLLSLKPEQYSSWKSVLLGAAVSQDTEEWCIHKAQMLCQHLSDDNINVLKRLAQLKDGADQAQLEQLGVVEGLRREERAILERSKEVLQSLLPQSLPWQRDGIRNTER